MRRLLTRRRRMLVDPRTASPPFTGPRPAAASDLGEIEELVRLCRSGRIYAIERWIDEGRPIHALNYRRPRKARVHSPLEIAIETNQLDLALLLLCNGYPPDSEERSLVVEALEQRKLPFFDLLLAWGADPLRVDVDTVINSCDAEICERFWTLGLDFTHDHALARALARNFSNRPVYGWARRRKDDPRIARELSIALGQAVEQKREQAVALLVWAGADSHAHVPDLDFWKPGREESEEDMSTPIVTALIFSHGHLLPLLKPDPARDDFEELWSWVSDPFAIDYLAKLARPKDWSVALVRNLEQMLHDYGDHATAKQCVERLTVAYDARLTTMTPDVMRSFRRDIIRCRDENNCRWVLRWLSYAETCERSVYEELMRSPAVRTKAAAVHVEDRRYRY